MRRAEKDTIKAGMVAHLTGLVQRHTIVLQDMRHHMHRLRGTKKSGNWASLTDWEGYYGLTKAQIVVLRRARHTLDAMKLADMVEEAIMAVFDDPKEKRLAEIEGALLEAGLSEWDKITCNHEKEIITDSKSGAPADTSIIEWFCPDCKRVRREELTLAEQDRLEAEAREGGWR